MLFVKKKKSGPSIEIQNLRKMPIWAHLYFNANLSVDDGLRGGEDEGRGDGLLVSLEAEVDLHGLRVRSSAINQ